MVFRWRMHAYKTYVAVAAPAAFSQQASAAAVGSKARELFAHALRQAAMGVQTTTQATSSGASSSAESSLTGGAVATVSSSAPHVPAPVVVQSHAHTQLELQKQQRLMQLLHALDCGVPPGGGCTFVNCELFKRSLPHYLDCQDPSCGERHCASSRFCLVHWASCTDPHCEVCPPVNRAFGASVRAQGARRRLLAQQHQLAGSAGGASGQYAAGMKRSASGGVGDGGSGGSDNFKRARVDAVSAIPTHAQIVAGISAGIIPGMTSEAWALMPVEAQQSWLERPEHQRRAADALLAHARQNQAAAVAASNPASLAGQRPSSSVTASQAPAARPSAKARIDGNCTLIATMSKVEILRHLTALREDCNAIVTPEQIRIEMGEIMNRIFEQVRCGQFCHRDGNPSFAFGFLSSAGPKVRFRICVPCGPSQVKAP